MRYTIDTDNKTLQFCEDISLQELDEILDQLFDKEGGIYKNLSEWKLIPFTKEIKSVEYQPYKLQEQPYINPYITTSYPNPITHPQVWYNSDKINGQDTIINHTTKYNLTDTGNMITNN
jgi:hypothetical protein